MSAALTHLSLSLSLSCPSSTPGLTARSRRATSPLVGKGTVCPPRGDDRRPRGVTRDRTRDFAATIGRQAHCVAVRRAPGGVAVSKLASLLPSLPARGRGVLAVRCAPGGVAVSKLAAVLMSLYARGRGVLVVRHAPGGVAVSKLAAVPTSLHARSRGVLVVRHAPGGVAVSKLAAVLTSLRRGRYVLV